MQYCCIGMAWSLLDPSSLDRAQYSRTHNVVLRHDSQALGRHDRFCFPNQPNLQTELRALLSKENNEKLCNSWERRLTVFIEKRISLFELILGDLMRDFGQCGCSVTIGKIPAETNVSISKRSRPMKWYEQMYWPAAVTPITSTVWTMSTALVWSITLAIGDFLGSPIFRSCHNLSSGDWPQLLFCSIREFAQVKFLVFLAPVVGLSLRSSNSNKHRADWKA